MAINTLSIQKLTGRDNFTTWKFAMEAYLQHEELWECIQSDTCDSKKDTKARTKLILLIDPQLYVHVQDAKTAKQVWDNLLKAFEDTGLLRKVGLLRDLITTNLESSTNIEEYINRLMSTAHKLRGIGFNVDDEWLGTLMLAGLSDEYKPMIMGIESSGIKISADMIKTKLLQEVKTSSESTTAFYAKSKKSINNTQHKDSHSGRPKGPRCFNCNKYGHMGKQCWFKNKNKEDKGTKNGFVAAFSATSVNDANSWYVDSGASAHMTMNRDWLENETAPTVQSIRIADNKVLTVQSCGTVNIQVPNKITGEPDCIQVNNVLFIPNLSTNLLSVSKIIMNGNKVEFDSTGCSIMNRNNQIVANAKLVNNTYKLLTYHSGQAMAATTEDKYLWHQRLGHLNFNDINKIPECTLGVKLCQQDEDYICTSCLEAKQTRQPFKNEGSRATSLLELIHSDLCGPMENQSLGGARYFLTFIDDFSRKVFVYFLKCKSEVLEKFLEFKNKVENELDCKIKILRSDNGREYINSQFDKCLKKFGIKHQTTIPYTPQQNGVSERMNRTLIERAKCMLFNASLQKEYWGEAIATAAYIINRSPTRSLSDITPEEKWTGSKPDLSHMKVFGCQAMVHIPKEKRHKLDAKSRNLTFIGYSECTKGYRFIDKKTKQVTMSRDVVFLEETVNQNKIVKKNSSTETTDKKCKELVEEKNRIEEKTFTNKSNNCSEENDCIVYIETDKNQTPSHNEEVNYESDSNSSTYYEDPNDETYIPTDSFNISTSSPEICHVNLRPRQDSQRQKGKVYSNSSDTKSFLCINSESAMSLLDDDPQDHTEALNSENSELWKQAMESEYKCLLENNTWSVIDSPVGKKVIPCKWVFKTKRDDAGNITRYKARLVIKGFKQTKGIDYNEVYAPVVRYSSVRYLIGLAAKYKLKIYQMDAISAFLQGDVDKEIYMTLPPCYEIQNKVCRLNKALYGLKQASRQWNKKLNAALIDIGLKRSTIDPCIYYRIVNEHDILFIAVYVDDLLYMFNNEKTALFVKEKLQETFKMKDLGTAKQCIGFKITQNTNLAEISLDQTFYIEKILHRFKMYECKSVPTPIEAGTQLKKAENETEVLKNVPYQEAVGCLLYLSQGTRPDIAYAVNTVSRFNQNPTMQHWIAVKRIFRYLKGTVNLKLTFKKDNKNIVGYCDADWASDTIDRRSCTGYLFIFQGACISWNSRKQATVALSSTEAEYMSLASAVQEAIWLRQLHDNIWHNFSGTPMTIYCDNRSAISLSGSNVYHARSKHIDVRYNFVKEKVAAKEIHVEYISTEFMLADALTKGLHRPKLNHLTVGMGLRSGEGVSMNAY